MGICVSWSKDELYCRGTTFVCVFLIKNTSVSTADYTNLLVPQHINGCKRDSLIFFRRLGIPLLLLRLRSGRERDHIQCLKVNLISPFTGSLLLPQSHLLISLVFILVLFFFVLKKSLKETRLIRISFKDEIVSSCYHLDLQWNCSSLPSPVRYIIDVWYRDTVTGVTVMNSFWKNLLILLLLGLTDVYEPKF